MAVSGVPDVTFAAALPSGRFAFRRHGAWRLRLVAYRLARSPWARRGEARLARRAWVRGVAPFTWDARAGYGLP